MGLFRKVKQFKERLCVCVLKIRRAVRALTRRIFRVGSRPAENWRHYASCYPNGKKADPLTLITMRHTANCLYAQQAFGHIESTSQSFSSTSSCALTIDAYDGYGNNHKPSATLTLGSGVKMPLQPRRRQSAASESRASEMLGYSSFDESTPSLASKCKTSFFGAFGTSSTVAPSGDSRPSYKARRLFCCRKSDALLLQQLHLDKIPVIIERFNRENRLPQLPKCQYVVPRYTTVGQLQHLIRTLLFDKSNMAIFIVVNGEIPALVISMEELCLRHRDEDGFLYVQFTSEDSFG